jgi:hypothetical protein
LGTIINSIAVIAAATLPLLPDELLPDEAGVAVEPLPLLSPELFADSLL